MSEERRVPRSVPRPESDRSRDKSHYDLNPDQPLPRSSPGTPRAPGALATPGERSGGRSHAVPALLRKRTTPAQ